MLALVMDIPLPVDAEPVEIVDQIAGKIGSAAVEINIFDTQQQLRMLVFSPLLADERRIGIAGMQMSGRAGGEAGAQQGIFPQSQAACFTGAG